MHNICSIDYIYVYIYNSIYYPDDADGGDDDECRASTTTATVPVTLLRRRLRQLVMFLRSFDNTVSREMVTMVVALHDADWNAAAAHVCSMEHVVVCWWL